MMLPDNEQNIVEIYKCYVEDVNQLGATQAVRDGTQVAILTLFLGAQAYTASLLVTGSGVDQLTSPGVVSWIPVIAVIGVGFLGRAFCKSWQKQVKGYKSARNFKFDNLKAIERRFPHSLAGAGAQLFLDEDVARKQKNAKAQAAQTGITSARPAPAQEATQAGAQPNRPKIGGQGAADQAAEIQELFESVLVVVATATFLVKAVATILPYFIPWLLHVRWP
jgi:hypothetical protein